MKSYFLPLQVLALASVSVFSLFMWQGNNSFSLWDDGFLWYGAQRVMLGEVPIRDFMAYDPGRYYWSAALMWLWDDNGIMALNGTVAIFQVIGLFAGLLLIARSAQNLSYLLLSTVTLAVWMFPHYKLFDTTVSILLISTLAFLVENPTNRRYFITGLCIGLAAVWGRNHGIYGIMGSIGVLLWLNINREEGPRLVKSFAIWAAGVAIGFVPILFMAALMPGFASAFWESVYFLFEAKSTNFALPVPWPWLVNFASLTIGEAIRGVLIGLLFVASLGFGMLSIVWVVWQKLQRKPVSPALVAASFLTLPYAHYAFSRAGYTHLALGIFPLLIACLIILATQPAKTKWPLAVIICGASLWVMHIYHPGWQCHASKQCADINVSGNKLIVDPSTASDVKLLRQLSTQYAPNGQSFIVAPFWPGAYALLGRKSPMWEIYPLWPRSQAFEQVEIERLKKAKPGFALIFDFPLDGRDELRYRNTHPLIHQYILDNFERFHDSPRSDYQIYIAKGSAALKNKASTTEKSNSDMINLKILNWGPRSTAQGVVPNLQPDGTAGIWIQVAADEELGALQVLVDGKPALSTSVVAGAITAAISADSFNTPGKKEISIKQVFSGKLYPVGVFGVNPKHN
jgi:hypothetical protein